MKDKKKILFIYTNFSSFVKTDWEILSKKNHVTKYHFKPVKGLVKTAIQLIKQLFYLLLNVWKFDVAFIWFADSHSFLPVLLNKLLRYNTVIVIGGFDATSIPYLNYGLYCSNKIRQFFGKYSIRNATYILPVDKSLIENINYYASENEEGLPVGVKNFVKNIKGNLIAIPTGYDTGFWQANSKIKRENSVVTVGYIPDWVRWKLKGCDFIQDIANQMPATEFHIYGLTHKFFLEITESKLPPNLILHKKTDREKLRDVYSQHKVYAQFSLSEGLPNVLCEAMLCGCIPVGSNVNGISNAIGDADFLLNKKDLGEACRLINMALKSNYIKADAFRDRIIELFNLDKRECSIQQIIENQINTSSNFLI